PQPQIRVGYYGSKARMKLSAVLCVCLAAVPAAADEGVWPFNQFPKEAIQQKHKFEVTDEVLNNLRLASVQIGGGSGSCVSAHGLGRTTQPIIAGCVPDVKAGFYAAARAQEIRCQRLDAAVLIKISDVTGQVRTGASDTLEQRNAAIAKIEK